MFSVGRTLQRARLEQELDIATVEARTKIKAKYLEAIEADDRTSLPSSFFYKHFVQQYARSLSLETKEIDAEIDRLLSADAPLPLPGQDNRTRNEVAPVLPARFHRTRTYASLAALIAILAACSGIYGWWHNGRSISFEKMTTVAASGNPTELIAQPVFTPRPPADVVTAPPHPATGSKVLLDLTAREETWLSVSSDGKPVFSGVLAANQSKTVEGKESAKVRVGNAAGIEVRFNGKLLGPLGRRGQVLVVVFTAGNFQVISPSKESD